MANELVRVSLPPDVRLSSGGLLDSALGQTYPLSPTARSVLELMVRGASPSMAAATLARRTGMPVAMVERDVRELAHRLNEGALLNLEFAGLRSRVSWVARSLWLVAISREVPRFRRQRFALRCDSVIGAHLDVARGVLGGLAVIWLILGAVGAVALSVSAASWAGVTLLAAFVAAVISHEAGHALAVGYRGGGAFLCVTGAAVAVVHTRNHSGPTVHAAGTLLTLAWGVVLLFASSLFGSAFLAVASAPFVAQAATLTVLSSDGRLLVMGR